MAKKFTRKIEDFTCSHCGVQVKGDGYTDHCPVCLWSLHVDINPGDRRQNCTGEMEPQWAEFKKDYYIIYYRCRKCHYQHRVKSAKGDNQEELLRLSNFSS